MKIYIVTLPPTPILRLDHRGPYENISSKFDQLWAWIEQNNIPATRSIGIYYDNPDFVPAGQLRSAACAELPLGYQLTVGGCPGRVDQIAGGEYAMVKHTGPYESLERVWSQFTAELEGGMGKRIKERDPAFEVYVSDPEVTPAAELITELYMPIH